MQNILKDSIQKRILLLVAIFFVSTAVLIVADATWRRYQYNYQSKIDNQIARRDLCESILRNLLTIQRDFYQLTLAKDSRNIRVIRNRITKSIEQIKSILGVLQNGGEFIELVPTNIVDVDEIETAISFYPDKGYVLEVIELTPLVLEIENAADKLAKAIEIRINTSNEEEQLEIINETTFLLKKAETVSLRTRESTNRIFHTSSQKIENLTRQEARILYNINIERFLFISVISIIEIIVSLTVFFGVRTIIREQNEQRVRLQQVLSITGTVIDIIDSDYNLQYIYADSDRQKIYGNPAGRKCYEYFNDLAEPCPGCPIPRAMVTKEKVVTEAVLSKENNKVFEIHTIPFQNATGKWLVAEMKVDITECKQVEHELKLKNDIIKQERNVFIAGPVVVFKCQNADGWPIEYVSPNVKEVFGYSPEEFKSGDIPYIDLILSADIERVKKNVTYQSKSGVGQFTHDPYRILRKNGDIIWVDDHTSIIRNTKGEITHYLGYMVDITKLKQAEKELAAEKESLAVTLRSIADGVITTDIEGKIVFINKVAEDLTGWSSEDGRGKLSHEVFSIVNEKTGQKCASPVSRVLELGRIVGLANHTALIAKNGTQISIADSGAPIRDAESKIIGVVIVFRDVTHERRIEEELLKRRKLESVGVLAGGIAHDFNNILVAILGNIELASLCVEDDEVTSLLSSAQKATKRATKLTQQLLTFSKGGDPVKEKTSLNKLIQESADFVLHGSKVGCEYSYSDDLWMVDADSGQLGQVIQNIIINAKQAMPEGGNIQINCSNIEDAVAESLLNIHDGNFVCIRIQDTGIGIPKEIIDKIFDPYYSTKQQGSGLGLAICHSIINKHDGHILVQSNPGKGTTFTIYLPAISFGETTAPKVPHTSSAVRAAKIMVMDDEEILREVVQMQLTTLGHESVLVADGEQAINEYQKLQDSETPVDLVIMDLTIPGGMGGKEAAKRLLQIDPRAKMIVVSGYSNDPVMAGYREYGFSVAIAKPFDLPELRKGIESALS